MKKLALAALLSASTLAAPGCLDAPQYVYGYDLSEQRLNLHALDMGVHPSTTVLLDPNNPFRYDGVGAETKWDILSYGNNATTFYAWATLLASQATGEHQYYTATALQKIYQSEEVSPAELPYVRDMAIAGFEALLEYFPESVTFDADFSFRLAPLAYDAIIDLGGAPPPGWAVVQTGDGTFDVIRAPNDAENAPAPEEEAE